MRNTVKAYIDRLKGAFLEDHHDDIAVFIDALAYTNFTQSVGGQEHCLEALNSLEDSQVSELPMKAGIPQIGYCKVKAPNPHGTLYWVENSKKIFKDRHVSPSNKAITVKSANQNLISLRRKIVWLSNLGEYVDGSDLVHGLGLYSKPFDGEVCIFSVMVNDIYKPTWVDAGFTFYWYAAHDFSEHGLTRDLRDGSARFKEWVAWKNETEITDFEVISAPGNEDLISNPQELSPTYIEKCRQEILNCRTASTGS